LIEGLSHYGDARNGKRALTKSASGENQKKQQYDTARDGAHFPHRDTEQCCDQCGCDPQAKQVEDSSGGKTDKGTQKRRPQINVSIGDTIEL
jgi:hypothetical protein